MWAIMWQRARLNSKPLVELTQSLIQERVILRADALIDTEAHTQGYTHILRGIH